LKSLGYEVDVSEIESSEYKNQEFSLKQVFKYKKYAVELTWFNNPNENELFSIHYFIGPITFSLKKYYGVLNKVAPKFLNPANPEGLSAEEVFELKLKKTLELLELDPFVRNIFKGESSDSFIANRETYLHIKYED
jgi:hypothetical protein